jgi:hypothetical protein
MYDSLSETNIELLKPLVEDKELAKNFAKNFEKVVENWKNLDIDNERRINFLFKEFFKTWESWYYQYRKSTLESWVWESHKNVMFSYFNKPGVQEWWSLRRQAFSKESRDFLENSSEPDNPILTFEAINKIFKKMLQK